LLRLIIDILHNDINYYLKRGDILLITLTQLKTSLRAVKDYINKVLPTKISDLTNDVGFITQSVAGKLTVGAQPTDDMDVATKKYVDDAVADSGSAVTYTLSITNNVITITGSDGSTSSVTLPVYNGGVSS